MITTMRPGATISALLCSPAIEDLHHLTRIEPFQNGRAYDVGWSCREHAALTGALLASQGVDSVFVSGANMFVVGPGSDGSIPFGVGNDVKESVKGHSWLRVDGFGAVDVSPRLNERYVTGPLVSARPIDAPVGWVGDSWLVAGKPAILSRVSNLGDFGREIATASHVIGLFTIEGVVGV